MYHAEKAWLFYCPYYITLLCKIAARVDAQSPSGRSRRKATGVWFISALAKYSPHAFA